MQHSSRKQLPPLLAEAELEIPKGWNALAFSLARDLEALALPAEYRIEKIFRIDEHIYVSEIEPLKNIYRRTLENLLL